MQIAINRWKQKINALCPKVKTQILPAGPHIFLAMLIERNC